MEIADAVSCDFFEEEDYEGTETSKLHILQSNSDIDLRLEAERIDERQQPETVTALNLERVELRTLQRIKEQLGNWLRSENSEPVQWRTRPLEGKFRDEASEKDVQSLEIRLSEEGLNIVGISPSGDPVENAVTIPPTSEIHDGEIVDYSFLRRVHSMLEIFLAGYSEDSEDILQLTGLLVHPERHLHPDLPEQCLDRLANEDYKGVIQRAGEALEEILEEKAPDDCVGDCASASALADLVFNDTPRGFRWGHVRSEQQGIQFLYSGSFRALRNPASHPRGDPNRNRYLDDICREDAIDALCLFNFLIRRLHSYGDGDLELDESEWGIA